MSSVRLSNQLAAKEEKMKTMIVLASIGFVTVLGCHRDQSENENGNAVSHQYFRREMSDLRDTVEKQRVECQRAKSDIDHRLDRLESRISNLEVKIRDSSRDNRNNERIQQQVNDLSEQISQMKASLGNVDSGSRRNRRNSGYESTINRDVATDTTAAQASKKSGDDLKRQLKENEKEIKKLREQNPACVLNTIDPPSNIRNTVMKYPTSGQRVYYAKSQITYVRDLFYCTKCHSERTMNEGPCCDVSRKKSFREWSQRRMDVGTTADINRRIDALLEKNQEIKNLLKAK